MTARSAFILGYTGATGKALVQQLITDDYFTRIVLVGRRQCDPPPGADDRFVQEVVDYDNIGDYSHVFKDCTVGFCCLGNNDVFADSDAFQRIDRDYVINTAAVAKDAGCEHFHVVTAANSSSDSKLSYRKVKGEAEDGLKALNLPKLTIYRPGFLRAKRQNIHCIFRTIIILYTCCCCWNIYCCCRRTKSIKVEDIAKAMLYKTKNPAKENIESLDNAYILDAAESLNL